MNDASRPPAPARGAVAQHPGRALRRAVAELPTDARAVVERAARPVAGSAYRTAGAALGGSTAWIPVVVHAPSRGASMLIWPTVRTAVPASASLALLGSLVTLANSVDPVGMVGMALGSALGAIVARTQYKLERDQRTLSALWLAADYSRVLVARFDTLGGRLTARPRWYLLPLEALLGPEGGGAEHEPPLPVAAEHEPPGARAAFRRWYARVRRTARALEALGIDGATIDAHVADAVHTLARLARFRRFARGGGRGA